MNTLNKIFIFVAVASLALSSCTKDFDEINTRKDRTTVAEPEFIFGLSPVRTLYNMAGTNSWFFFGNYTNQWSVIGGGGPHFGFDGRSDGLWSSFYTSSLNPCYQIIKSYGDNPAYANRVAIAKIWKSYIFSQITALYGPCPYTHAVNGLADIPYDKEEVVYRGILQDLKDAYTALKLDGDKYPAEAEPFLQSDIARWGKFAHCIRLRTAMRLTEVSESWAPGLAAEAQSIVAEELNNGAALITSNAENFSMKFGETLDEQNPLYREVISNPERDIVDPGNWPVIHESLMLWIHPNTYNDPCLTIMCDAGSGGSRAKPIEKYIGRPHSEERPQDYQPPQGWNSPYGGFKYLDFSTIAKTFSGMVANYYFFSYPEICFMRAEAAIKGYWSGDAEANYYEGIEARSLKYGAKAADITNYINQPGIKWSTPADSAKIVKDKANKNVSASQFFRDYLGGFTDSYLGGPEDNYKRIIVQHWISLFGQNIDCYTLVRRTNAIPFKPHFGVDQNNGYVDGKWGFTPQRIVYPGTERTMNQKECDFAINNYLLDKGNAPTGQRDQVTYRLIFAKDNPGLPQPQPFTIAYRAYPYELPNLARNRQ